MRKIFSLAFLLVASPLFAQAEGYDFYVNKNYSGEEIGSQEKPFRTIKDAVSKAEQSRKGLRRIFISNGEYVEDAVISDSVKLFGESKEETVLQVPSLSTIRLAGDNRLKDLTIAGGAIALTINGNAIVENCIIKDAKKKGIEIIEGKSLVAIKNSLITNNGGKGVYIQKGNSILLTNNTVAYNRGEGFDIRQNISGVIAENEISNNTESGIEVLTGASDLLIKKNTVRNNLANGIANQSYPEIPETGKIKLFENILTQNGKYGIYCGAPSGGDHANTYFSESIVLDSNINNNNKGKPVSGSCHFGRQTNDYIQNIASDVEKITTKAVDLQEQFDKTESQIDAKISSGSNISTKINATSLLNKIFIGFNEEEILHLQAANDELVQGIEILSDISNNSNRDSMRTSVANLAQDAKKEISANDVVLRKSKRSNTLFWLTRKIASFFN
ncbi:MAG: hypothetical protein ACD_14C00070G0002 [uncultured bacterium]|nr:MAG: hypothetical protein ACD_14C00070G0002 [uncultured bacterium]KKQ43714.1 MAG: hypothetical protein US63_C0046G0002 [Candidatus Moranbacteria bacterium GW2011_GWC2_37_8]